MPCYDGGSSVSYAHEEKQNLRMQIEKLEAVLCNIMTINPKIVDQIDWNEVGITKEQHLKWWEEHQKQDLLRKQREKQRAVEERLKREKQRKTALLKKKALARLSDEEKKALGIF